MRNYFYGTRVPHEQRTTFVIKSHALYNDRKFFNWKTRRIILVRNPFEAFVSNFNLKRTGHNRGVANQGAFRAYSWRKYVTLSTRWWQWKLTRWLGVSGGAAKAIVVHYEDLRADLPGQLARLADFLRLRVDPGRLRCLLDNPYGMFQRSQRRRKPVFPYLRNETAALEGAVCAVGEKLRDVFGVALPLDKYVEVLHDKFADEGEENVVPDAFDCG